MSKRVLLKGSIPLRNISGVVEEVVPTPCVRQALDVKGLYNQTNPLWFGQCGLNSGSIALDVSTPSNIFAP
jgi:hypothetical protein